MVNLFDIMRQAQQGAGMDTLARQFGLSVADTQRAVEAMLPAFSLGLQQSLRRPDAFAQILDNMSSGRYAPFFDQAGFLGAARGPNGQDVLLQIFGDPEVTGRIARQVSAMTGVTAQVLQQMMPSVAAMLMGGLFRFASVDGMAEFLHRWADWLKSVQPRPAPAPAAPPSGPDGREIYAAWSEFVGTLYGQPRRASAATLPADPWSAMVRVMMTGGRQPEPPPPPPPAAPNPFATLQAMFETGREVQAQHLAGFQAIMDGLWKGVAPR